MADTPAATATLRAAFAKNAVLPRRHIAAVEKFIDHLHQSVAQGQKPSSDDLQRGAKLLEGIQNQTEIFMFSAAILAGQDAAGDRDLDRKLQAISEGIDKAEATSRRLQETLNSFS